MKTSSGDDNAQSTEQPCKGFVASSSCSKDLQVEAKAYIKEVHQRFGRRSDEFNGFIELLREFRYKRTDAASLEGKVRELFGGHHDLILKFDNFMPRHNDDDDKEDEDEDDDNDSEKTTPLEYPVEVVPAADFLNKVKIRFPNNKNVYEEFKQIMQIIINLIQEGERCRCKSYINDVATLFKGHPDLLQEFSRMISDLHSSNEIQEEKKQTQYIVKPSHELELSEWPKESPSYWVLPENYSLALASHRSEIGDQVLNDRLICVNSRGENYTDKQKHITEQETVLFRCEDDKYEMDMLLEYVTSASQTVNKLLTKIRENEIDTSKMKIEDYLSIFELRCIERLYGEHGLEIMELLQNDPASSLPAISSRLNLKKEELRRGRSDFDRIWAHVFAKNQLELQEQQQELEELQKQQELKNLKLQKKQQELKNLDKEIVASELQGTEKKKKKQKEKDEAKHITSKEQPKVPES